jgi:hypothetical protein
MKRFKSSLALLPLVFVLAACQDQQLRTWAVAVSDTLQKDYEWERDVVFPGLRAYCELERHVYDQFHSGTVTPVNRYCPPGGTDPVAPPGPPPQWD